LRYVRDAMRKSTRKLFQMIDRWRAVYIERCTYGLGGGLTETARASGYGVVGPTL